MNTIEIKPEAVKQAIKKMEQQVGVTVSRDMFLSFHVQRIDNKEQGFGNTVIKFYPEIYKNDMAKFIEHIQKALEFGLEQQHKTKYTVKIINFI